MSPLPLVISLTYIYIDHLYTHALVQILIIRQTKKPSCIKYISYTQFSCINYALH